MKYYFVDYENVGSDGLSGINTLDENNTVYIFYSRNADKITFEIHMQLNETKASVTYYKIDAGHKNALDFQLSSYMGYVIHQDTEAEYYVVSKDNGFNALLSFWEKFNVKLSVIRSICPVQQDIIDPALPNEITEPKAPEQTQKPVQNITAEHKPSGQIKALPPTVQTEKNPSELTAKEIRTRLTGQITDKAILTEVVRIIRTYKTRQGINNALVKKYESQKAGEIYKIIRPLIAYKKGS